MTPKRGSNAHPPAPGLQRAILECALDSIVMMDGEGVVREFNAAAERTFGYTRAESVGRDMADLIIPARFREAHRRGLARAVETGKAPLLGSRLEMIAARADGTEFPVELTIARTTDAPAMFIGYIRDLSRQKAADASLEQRAEQLTALAGVLERTNRDLDQANRAKDAFMATLSHELRTPLNAILGWAQLLSRGALDEAQTTRAVQTIVRNAQAQARLIEDLLDISRIAAGKLQLEFGPVDLSRLIESLVESFQPDAAARSLTLTFATGASCHVVADARRIQQAVGNLIANAIKFTPPGGSVSVSLGPCEGHAVVTVRDTGVGLDPEFLPRAFERFQQEGNGTTRQYDGLGLGLSIVRHLVALHTGTVTADSAGRGHGATFTVSLPLVTVAPAPAGEGREPAGAPPLASIHVLCVDDNPESLSLMAAALSQSGARVTTVLSAADALRAIEAETPDVLISDIAMPRQDGYALIRAVRASPIAAVRAIPAAAITAYATAADRAHAADAGFQSHVAKPIQPAEFTAIVAALAASRRTCG